MLFMVIERFRDNDMVPVYKKLRDTGRMIPEGLKYIDSWVEPNSPRREYRRRLVLVSAGPRCDAHVPDCASLTVRQEVRGQ